MVRRKKIKVNKMSEIDNESANPDLWSIAVKELKENIDYLKLGVRVRLDLEQVSTNTEIHEAVKYVRDNSFQQSEVAKGIAQMMIELTDMGKETIKSIVDLATERAEFDVYVRAEKVELNTLKNVSEKWGSARQRVIVSVMGSLALVASYFLGG